MDHRTCMVIGGGIAGIQASLDLAGMGVETYLVERAPSIGGRMAQLDKTFPTNDCAMCILSPKLVEVGSHPNIHIIANAEVQSVEGEAGDFHVSVLKKARYVDETRCTGCGICVSKCPVRIPDKYNMGLSKTKCISIPYPQAVPAIPLIDRASCLFFKRGRCKLCEKNCEEKVIDFEQKDEILDLQVGSIVFAVGSGEFDATLKEEYAYGTSPNVMTSIEFERLLSASGPTQGHVVRASDQKEPRRVAFLQCVGSRDRQVGHGYCSSICCMQAAKDAVILSEHLKDVQATIFNMDTRAQGKDFDKFIERAQDQYGVRVVRGRISSVEINPASDDLVIRYARPGGAEPLEEEFDLVVLSVGLHSTENTRKIAELLDVELDESGFVVSSTFDPVAASRPGIFGCGTIMGPKDIPETVVEASGAACAAASVAAKLPSHFVEVEYPPERDTGGEPLRTGVFVCRCGINIAATVDVPGVVEHAKALPGVAHAQEFTFACAGDSQIAIADVIKEHGLNRVIVAACTPRTHEPLFQKTLQTAGLNPYMFEFANIREHCSWVHQKEPERATEKAKGLVRMAVAKAALLEPLSKTALDANRDGLVIGGGVAGMTAALEMAKQGSHVHIVERESALGGNFRDVRFTMDGGDAPALMSSLVDQVNAHEGIDVHLGSLVEKVDGFVGNFRSVIGPADGGEGERHEIEHGAVIVATGARESDTKEYMRGSDPRVVTQKELELALGGDGAAAPDLPDLNGVRSAVFIQCVGSRDEERPYCSRICCNMAIKNALKLKDRNPEANIYVLYRDIRAYGLSELRYREARERGVIFIRYEPESRPEIAAHNGALRVRVDEPVLGRRVAIDADLVVLAPAITANPDNKTTAQMLKVPLNDDGFFLEAHVKLRPVDFATDGVFVCGLAHYPKNVSESIAQAKAAAGRALAILSKGRIEADGKVSRVRANRCEGCGACVSVCAYGAVEIDEVKNVAVVNEAVCKGCGACAATCRSSAIDLGGFRDEQVVAALEAMAV